MRKTRSLMSLEGLRDLVSDSMAIDIGSTSVIIAVRGRSVVVDEPAVVAVNKLTGEAVAFGREAHDMLGREARDVSLVAPLVDGVVADFERTRKLLDHFVRAARSGVSHFSRRAVMSVLSGITQVEQRALLAALLLQANEVVSRDRLVDALWGEDPPDTARNTIQVYVSQLRKLLPDGTLETAPPGYRLAVDPATVDLFEFVRLSLEGRTALTMGDAATAGDGEGAAAGDGGDGIAGGGE